MQAALRYSYRDTSSHRTKDRTERVMTARRRNSPDEASYHRRQLEREEDRAVVDAIGDRMESFFDRALAELEMIKSDIRRIDQKTDGVVNRVNDLERETLETREAVHRARSAQPALTVSAGRQVVEEAKKSWVARTAAVVGLIIALASVVSLVPKAVRGVEHAWAYFRTADVQPQPKTDKTTAT